MKGRRGEKTSQLGFSLLSPSPPTTRRPSPPATATPRRSNRVRCARCCTPLPPRRRRARTRPDRRATTTLPAPRANPSDFPLATSQNPTHPLSVSAVTACRPSALYARLVGRCQSGMRRSTVGPPASGAWRTSTRCGWYDWRRISTAAPSGATANSLGGAYPLGTPSKMSRRTSFEVLRSASTSRNSPLCVSPSSRIPSGVYWSALNNPSSVASRVYCGRAAVRSAVYVYWYDMSVTRDPSGASATRPHACRPVSTRCTSAPPARHRYTPPSCSAITAPSSPVATATATALPIFFFPRVAEPSVRSTIWNAPERSGPNRCRPSAVNANRPRCGDHPVNCPNPPAVAPPSARWSKHGPHVSPIHPSASGVPTAPHRHTATNRSPVDDPRTPSTASGYTCHHGGSPRSSTSPRMRATAGGCGR